MSLILILNLKKKNNQQDFGRKNEEKYKEKMAEVRGLKEGMRVERNDEHWQWDNQV